MPHVRQTTPEQIGQDVAVAVERLRSAGAGSVFTVGFRFGGSHSWRLSASGLGLSGGSGGTPARTPGAGCSPAPTSTRPPDRPRRHPVRCRPAGGQPEAAQAAPLAGTFSETRYALTAAVTHGVFG